jgi:hypothetical protein
MKPEFRDKWDAAGYGRKMGSACVVPPPPEGIRRVYHFTSAAFAINDIALAQRRTAGFDEAGEWRRPAAAHRAGVNTPSIL